MFTDATLAYFLIALGLVLMAAELLLPTGGLLLVVGIGGLIAGVAMLFAYDKTHAVVTLLALIVVLTAAGPVLVRLWPRTAVGKQMVLNPERDEDAAVAA